jgi:hypothetical protein
MHHKHDATKTSDLHYLFFSTQLLALRGRDSASCLFGGVQNFP